MKPNHLVVTGELCHARATWLHNRGLLLELLDCAPVMEILFWEKQKLHQITNNQTADLVFGETGGSQRPVMKRNRLLASWVLKCCGRGAALAAGRPLQFLWSERFTLWGRDGGDRAVLLAGLSGAIPVQSQEPK